MIVSFAALSTPPYAVHRTLCRLSLVHSHFRDPAQTLLFKSLRVGTEKQLLNLVDLLDDDEGGARLGRYVRRVIVAEEGEPLDTARMAHLARTCPKLDEVVFRSVEVDAALLSDRECCVPL